MTLVGVAVANLEDDRALQLMLPFDPRNDGALDAAVDEVRARFGSESLTRAVLLGRGEGSRCPCSRTDDDVPFGDWRGP